MYCVGCRYIADGGNGFEVRSLATYAGVVLCYLRLTGLAEGVAQLRLYRFIELDYPFNVGRRLARLTECDPDQSQTDDTEGSVIQCSHVNKKNSKE